MSYIVYSGERFSRKTKMCVIILKIDYDKKLSQDAAIDFLNQLNEWTSTDLYTLLSSCIWSNLFSKISEDFENGNYDVETQGQLKAFSEIIKTFCSTTRY